MKLNVLASEIWGFLHGTWELEDRWENFELQRGVRRWLPSVTFVISSI